jgi:hypothetical protein
MTRGPIGVLLGVAVASCVLIGAVEAQTPNTNSIVGTWRLNVERSVWSPGPRLPADSYELRRYFVLDDGWYGYILTGRNLAGNPTFQAGAYKLDGQRRPWYNIGTLMSLLTDQPTNLTRSYRVIDEGTMEFTHYNANGVIGAPWTRTLTADGMRFIQVQQGTTAQGVAIRNVLVYERVN